MSGVSTGDQDYDCNVVNQTVQVSIELRPLHGQFQSAVSYTRQMIGCTGNAICKKFPTQQSFRRRASGGCPAHEMLR